MFHLLSLSTLPSILLEQVMLHFFKYSSWFCCLCLFPSLYYSLSVPIFHFYYGLSVPIFHFYYGLSLSIFQFLKSLQSFEQGRFGTILLRALRVLWLSSKQSQTSVIRLWRSNTSLRNLLPRCNTTRKQIRHARQFLQFFTDKFIPTSFLCSVSNQSCFANNTALNFGKKSVKKTPLNSFLANGPYAKPEVVGKKNQEVYNA